MASGPGLGDDANWRELFAGQFRQNAKRFYRTAHGVLRDHGEAEDVCQEAMAKAWEHREKLRDAASIRSWLTTVILRLSLQRYRRRKIEMRAMTKHAPELGGWGDPVAKEEQQRVVVAALESLPELTRVVVALRTMQGVSGNDAADFLGCSASEVSRQLTRGLEMLRIRLSEYHRA